VLNSEIGKKMGKPGYINIRGRLVSLKTPRIMGIINITPDSFYKGSRYSDEKSILSAAEKMIGEGADFIDIGGYSSRPGAGPVELEEEKNRVLPAIKLILSKIPDAIISVDTFRASVAREAVCDCGADIINDISGGEADSEMFPLIKELNVPYILMHMQGTPATMQINPVYDDIVADILQWFGKRIVALHSAGVKDLIIDPGFGFGKSIDQNFELLGRLKEFSLAALPLMAGLSRKSMVWKTLDTTPSDSLTGTIVLNTIALLNGANILRVHDVKEARQAIQLVGRLKEAEAAE
jgi:dihydropteroate synthase